MTLSRAWGTVVDRTTAALVPNLITLHRADRAADRLARAALLALQADLRRRLAATRDRDSRCSEYAQLKARF